MKTSTHHSLAMDDHEEIEQREDTKDENIGYDFHLEQYSGEEEDEEGFEDENGDDVYAILAQKEKDLLLAAELGKALLEKNEELTQKYERLQEDYAQHAEELEQEKHELRLRIERLGRSHDSRVHELQTDIQSLQSELRSLRSASLTDSASKRKTFAGLTKENEKLNLELCQLRDDNNSLQEELGNLKKQHLSTSFSIDDYQNQQIEYEEISEKLTRIEEERNFLRQNVEELLSNKESLTKDIEELQSKNEDLKKSFKDVKNQLIDTEDKLNESKNDNLNLKDQLDELKIQASLDQASRGSLFSELSDMAISSEDVTDGLPTPVKTTKEHHVPSSLSSQAVTSSPALVVLGSNKRPRQYASVDSDEDSEDSDIEYDEADDEIDGFVARNVDFYAQLEEQQKVNSELKKEIIEAHNELRICYDKLRLAHENRASKVEPLDPNEEYESGCLTTFVQNFKDVVDDILKVYKKHSSTRKNSGYAGSMVGSYSDNLLDQIRQLKEDLYQAYKDMEHLKEKNVTHKSKLKQKEIEITELNENLTTKTEEVKQLQEERKRLVLKECDPNLAFNRVFKQALLDKEEALRRECELALELEKSKRDAGRLDKQLMEAIQQKIELSEQLEEWQYDMASLIDEQVQKQMRSAASEKGEVRARKSLFSKGWNWSPTSKRQNIL